MKIQKITKLIMVGLMLLPSFLIAKNLDLIKNKTFQVNPGELLKLNTDLGDVVIKTWDKDNLSVKIYGDDDAKNKMEFSIEKNKNEVEIIGELDGVKLFRWFSNIELKYELNVPENFNTNIKTSGGDIMIIKIEGTQNLATSGGDIFVKDSEGELDAKTSGGDITIKKFLGNVNLLTSGGDISTNTIGQISAKTSGGDIKIKCKNGKVLASTSGGDIVLELKGENNGVKLATSGGDIEARIPQDFNADLELKTAGGDVRTNLKNVNVKKKTESKLIGKLNTGGKNFICKTSGGDIFVKSIK